MINENEGKKLKEYEYENGDNKDQDPINNTIKYIIFLIIALIIIIIIYLVFKNFFVNKNYIYEYNLKIQKKYENKSITINDFKEIIPQINSVNNIEVTNMSQLFQSRVLFINSANVTNNYIYFVRKSDIKQEKEENNNYYKQLYPNKDFNDYSSNKFDQVNLNNFFDVCNQMKLIESNQIKMPDNPSISIIISLINKKEEILRSINSIQSQTFKNIEIIIVDDSLEKEMTQILQYIYDNELRVRLISHTKKMGLWRSRLDGFLYSRGKYILHFDAGDIFSDSLVLEETFNLVTKYTLDTLRFSFSKTKSSYFLTVRKFKDMIVYPSLYTKIIYETPDYNVKELGFGTICNRLIRANVITKALFLVDDYILNANKTLWEDMWWNELVDKVSFSNLAINRIGYIYLYNKNSPNSLKVKDKIQKDETIREFIYLWLFNYQLLPKQHNKKKLVNTLRYYSMKNNEFSRVQMTLEFLLSSSPILNRLLNLLYNDPYVQENDKFFLNELYKKYNSFS